jgi:hypothetical protein
MKKVPLYTLSPDDVCIIQNIKMKVTATKTVKEEGNNSFQQIYCKALVGNQMLHAPAGLMVTKVE